MDQNSFTEILREVSQIIRTAASPLSKEEILGYFSEIELTEEQKEMVFSYLLTSHEDESVHEENEESGDDSEEEDNKEEKNEDMSQFMPQSKMFQMYMEEIQMLPKFTDDEKNDMYERLLSGDDTVIKTISEFWLEKVLDMAKLHLSSKYNLEDVIQEGNMAVFLKLGDICGRGDNCDVNSELEVAVESAMKSYIAEITGEEDSENTIVGKADLVDAAEKYLKGQDGQEPDIDKLADFTKISKDELGDILEIINKAKKHEKK